MKFTTRHEDMEVQRIQQEVEDNLADRNDLALKADKVTAIGQVAPTLTDMVDGEVRYYTSDGVDYRYTRLSSKLYIEYMGGYEDSFTTPASLTVNAGGTPVGDVTDIQSLLDGNIYQLPETTGTPGFDIEINFTGITTIKGLAARFYYDGGVAGHAVTLDIYDYSGAAWDEFILVPSASDYSYRYIKFPGNVNYIDSGAAKLRFYHSTAGNASHDLYIDYVALIS